MGLSFTLLFLAVALIGLLVMAGGVVLLMATKQKKAGVALLIAGLVFIVCPVLAYTVVLLSSTGSM